MLRVNINMGIKHEDMDAYTLPVSANENTTYTAFSGTSAVRIHHMNIYNSSTSLSASVYIKVSEGTSGSDHTLRHVNLQPEQHTTWAGGLGDDDSIKINAINNGASAINLDITWW